MNELGILSRISMNLQSGSPTKTLLLTRLTIFCTVEIVGIGVQPTSKAVRSLHNTADGGVVTIRRCWNKVLERYFNLVEHGRKNRSKVSSETITDHINMRWMTFSECVFYQSKLRSRDMKFNMMIVYSRWLTSSPASMKDTRSSGRLRSSSTSFDPVTMTAQRSGMAILNMPPLYCILRSLVGVVTRCHFFKFYLLISLLHELLSIQHQTNSPDIGYNGQRGPSNSRDMRKLIQNNVC